jgi:hypothetical protein
LNKHDESQSSEPTKLFAEIDSDGSGTVDFDGKRRKHFHYSQPEAL